MGPKAFKRGDVVGSASAHKCNQFILLALSSTAMEGLVRMLVQRKMLQNHKNSPQDILRDQTKMSNEDDGTNVEMNYLKRQLCRLMKLLHLS